VALHPDAVVRHEYAVMVSRRTGVDLDVVERAIAGTRPSQPGVRPVGEDRRLTGQQRAERELIRLVLANDTALREHEVDISLLTDDAMRVVYKLVAPTISVLPPGVPPDLGTLYTASEPEVAETLSRLALEDRPLPDAADVITKLRIGGVERRIQEVHRELDGFDRAADPQGYSAISRELIALQAQRRELREVGR
jgi:hypothetical protein